MTDVELRELLHDLESDRVERKRSAADMGKIRQAICAFANDLPNYQAPGVLFVGAEDDGSCSDTEVTDELLRKLGGIREEGKILPQPSMSVERRDLDGCQLAVVTVQPADRPPVRCDGRTWIRVGPRRATATTEEESRLAERSVSRSLPFDVQACYQATADDLSLDRFQSEYLPRALAPDVIEQNQRPIEHQLVALRMSTAGSDSKPTNLAVLLIGREPRRFFPGAYIQFLRIDGTELTDHILDQKEIDGPVSDVLRRLTDVLKINIRTATDVRARPLELRYPDYPIVALDQISRNAVLHRTYEASHAPVRIYWFNDRVEIHSPGGPYGQVNRDNFGTVADYRNPHLAEALKNLGFVQKFGLGIPLAKSEMEKNGNPAPRFEVHETNVLVTLPTRS